MIPDLSVLWVIGFVLLLVVLLDRLLLKPLQRIMHERQGAIESARDLAERSATRAAEATAEFDTKTKAARAEIYRQMDEQRRVALASRAELLSATRQEVEASVEEGRAGTLAEAERARETLARDAEALGAVIADRVLGTRS